MCDKWAITSSADLLVNGVALLKGTYFALFFIKPYKVNVIVAVYAYAFHSLNLIHFFKAIVHPKINKKFPRCR